MLSLLSCLFAVSIDPVICFLICSVFTSSWRIWVSGFYGISIYFMIPAIQSCIAFTSSCSFCDITSHCGANSFAGKSNSTGINRTKQTTWKKKANKKNFEKFFHLSLHWKKLVKNLNKKTPLFINFVGYSQQSFLKEKTIEIFRK